MRIVIDMQGAQAENRHRGIGRYTMAFSQALARNRGHHEVILALNGLLPDTIEPIRAAFHELLPQSQIVVWEGLQPAAAADSKNDWRRQNSERLREAFLGSLNPDLVVISSLMEGLGDDAVTTIGSFGNLPTASLLYDLIPYIYRQSYLKDPRYERWYLGKLDHLRRADLWLAISESSRREGVKYLNLPASKVINVSTAADPHFQRIDGLRDLERSVRDRYGLRRPFVMYSGGIDHRKNIEGLIRAFAKLPDDLRREHQLAIVCAARNEDVQRLQRLARKHGLAGSDLVMTGFVPEDDLVALYNLCRLFVFPSWHEGFGLPVLEAMRCGAPVIGANRSSIPEVLGWEEALFDPYSDNDIAAAMARALRDDEYRGELIRRGVEQARKFSWDVTASRAISALEAFHVERTTVGSAYVPPVRRPRLAYVSPLPPARSGIADYSAELLPELARHYEIELITTEQNVSDPQARASWPVRSVDWFREHADEYDRVIYHFGNSDYHAHMFRLLRTIPGVVVLHDFFLSGLRAHMEFHHGERNAWLDALYYSHGYKAVTERVQYEDDESVIWEYPCNLDVIQNALGLIVHSAYSRDLAAHWYGVSNDTNWAVIPHMRQPAVSSDRGEARSALGIDEEDFLVCSFGMLGPTKLNDRLLEAWLSSSLSGDDRCHLVFVGENHSGEYGQRLIGRIKRSGTRKRIHITGWADADTFRHYLAAADTAVQLRTLSRGETSGTVLDCMNHGLATVINGNGSMAEISENAVWKLPNDFAVEHLVEALETLRWDDERRTSLGANARKLIRSEHDPRFCGDQYASAIEDFYRQAELGTHALIDCMASAPESAANGDLMELADAISRSLPPSPRQRQLLVDISELVQRDVRSGIQRVVRSLLSEFLHNPPAGFRVEPVYATVDEGYRYARRYTAEYLGFGTGDWMDDPIDPQSGDVFLGLDLQPHVVCANRGEYQRFRRKGVEVWFVVYDLLCVLMPEYFVEGGAELHRGWLSVVVEADGAVCISRAVANELNAWQEENGPQRHRPFSISWFHLGADIENSRPTRGFPEDAEQVLARLRGHPTFLMVGTLEPRKRHAQVLDAFEELWALGLDVNLVIVGKQGWMVEPLVERLQGHEQLDVRLFWLSDVSDDYLVRIYEASTCLIAASQGEGFGLPLIEAAQNGLPIIARDIPVFREVAADYAYYFPNETSGSTIACAVQRWLSKYEAGDHPDANAMSWITWKESADQLLGVVLDQQERLNAKNNPESDIKLDNISMGLRASL